MSSDDGHESDAPDGSDAEAAAWLMRLSEATLGDQLKLHQEFARWRDANPKNAETFMRLERAWHASNVDRDSPDLAPLVANARAELDRLRRKQSSRRVGRHVVVACLAAAVATSVAILGFMYWPPNLQTYQTAIGEVRTVKLADRSVIQMDADSTITVALSSHQRLIHILSGRAYFQVVHDPERPFIVESHSRSVTATGTAFDVEARAQGLQVILVEGHVFVRARIDGPIIARLEPGDALTTEIGSPPRLVQGANLATVLAWRSGRIIFDDELLGLAIGRMSHYVATKVVVDPSAARLRISGVFAARDLSGLISALERSDRVRARRDQAGTIHLGRTS